MEKDIYVLEPYQQLGYKEYTFLAERSVEMFSLSARWMRQLNEFEPSYADKKLVEIISKFCLKGNTLEAMSGGISYIYDTIENSVTGLDFCAEYIFNYYPKNRRRVCFDLSELAGKDKKIYLFQKEEFSTIVECFGYKYPKDIVSVFKEFYRILDDNGVLILLENIGEGAVETFRTFKGEDEDKKRISEELQIAGFKSVLITNILNQNDHFLIEARK